MKTSESIEITVKNIENTDNRGDGIMKVVEGINDYLTAGVELYAGKIVKEDGAQFIRLELRKGKSESQKDNFLLKAIETIDLKITDDLLKLYPFGFKGGRQALGMIEAKVHDCLHGITPVLSTRSLGFVEQYGEVVGFRGVNWIPAPEKEGVDKAISDIELPRVVGEMNIEKLKEILDGKRALQLVVLWNLMAPLVAFLSKDTAVCNPILLLHGKSSSGKTTAATLAASMSCNVDYKRLINGLATTDNALMLKLGGINGLGVVLDDTSNSGIKRITDVLYSLSDGFGKTRATSRGGMLTSKGFRTSIILTSESNLLDYADVEKEGLYGRVFPLAVSKDNLFTSASEASATMAFCRESAGHMVNEVVNSIFKFGRTELKNKVDMKEAEFLSKYGCNNSIVARWGKIISIMELASEFSSLDFDMESIKKLMVDNIEKSLGWVRGVQAESQIDNFYTACVEGKESIKEVVKNNGVETDVDYYKVTPAEFKKHFKDCIMPGLNQRTLKLKLIQSGRLKSAQSEVRSIENGGSERFYKFLKKEDDNSESSII